MFLAGFFVFVKENCVEDKNCTILMIDDNPLIMGMNRDALNRLGYRVLEAETICQGRILFETEKPDLIVMETILPDGGGLRFCKEIRCQSRVPIMFVSIHGTAQDEIAGLDAGCSAYVSKPCNPGMLVARIKALLCSESRLEDMAFDIAMKNNRMD